MTARRKGTNIKAGESRFPKRSSASLTQATWLSRALAKAGVLTLKEAEKAILAGRVRLNGHVVKAPFHPVALGAEVRLDGRAVPLDVPTQVLMFHKPKGAVTSRATEAGAPTVFSILLPKLPREFSSFEWHAVGRLDKNTTGLLLFTNDEKLVAHATSPQAHLTKRYLATVQGRPTAEQLEPIRKGMRLQDGAVRPAGAVLRAPSEVELTLSEGKFHQVKRMLGALGFPVLSLHREAVGSVELNVAEGEFRRLTRDEISYGLGFQPP